MPLAIRQLTKSFGDKKVLRGVSHVFPEKGASLIGGPSGCGKTTLLRILLGLEKADGGEIHMPDRASAAAVFQEDRLIMHMSALGNLALACPRYSESDMLCALSSLGLDGASKEPVRRYSGGMRRRVAIARAVLADSELLVMDEPFKGLDAGTRAAVAQELRRRFAGRTVILVTHSPEEAALFDAEVIRMEEIR